MTPADEVTLPGEPVAWAGGRLLSPHEMAERCNPQDLHTLAITVDVSGPAGGLMSYYPLRDHSVEGERIAVYFRDLQARLIRHIMAADVVVGCVAWLSNHTILDALATRRGVGLVVQKEDFLRPDLSKDAHWSGTLRKAYDALPPLPERWTLGGLLGRLSTQHDPVIAPVRCVGNHNAAKRPAWPRMHNKFLVFGTLDEGQDEDALWSAEEPWPAAADNIWPSVRPHSVWTGSFNLSHTATRSFENAVYIADPVIAQAFYDEWEQIEALSEPLDWTVDWVMPEWRIGT
jgi:hypothetical protein